MADSPLTLEEAIRKLTTHQISLAETLQTMALKLDELLHRLPPVLPDPVASSSPTPVSPPAITHKIKIDVPRFDGNDPMGWIFKITQFFEYHQTPENERLTVASFYMDGQALSWFQWMNGNHQFTSWQGFLQALQTHFAPSQYEDPTGTLFKLTQHGMVAEYLAVFEELANRTIGLPSPFLLSCFVSGLTPEIRREVQAHQPLTLVQAAGLARLQEEKIMDARPQQRPKPPPPLHSPSLTQPLPLRTLNPNPTPLLPSPPRPTPPAVKRLTPKEIATRRERGLCFNCDERYHRGHRCSSRFFLLISEDDDPPPLQIPQPNLQPEPETPTPDPIDPYPTQISFNSLAGNVAPETLRFMGTIGNRHVVQLVDGGSTHNFIQHQLVSQLSLTLRTTTPLRVMVGNGQQLECTSICESVPVTIQATEFIVDLHVLPIAGANVVLGVQWLKSLGPVLTDYNSLRMKFFHAGTFVELQGDTETTLNSLSSSQFHRLLQHQPESLYFHITVLSDDNSMAPSDIDPAIQELINRFHSLFRVPEELPPARPTDHRIHLIPNATPVNVRPYRYPHFQKQEIEAQVELMLQKGLIQPSNSPFLHPFYS